MYSDVNEANYEDEDEDEDEDGYATKFSQLSFSILVCGLSWLYLIKFASTSLRREILSKLLGKRENFSQEMKDLTLIL